MAAYYFGPTVGSSFARIAWLLINSDYADPLNIGSDERVSINQLMYIVEEIAGVKVARDPLWIDGAHHWAQLAATPQRTSGRSHLHLRGATPVQH